MSTSGELLIINNPRNKVQPVVVEDDNTSTRLKMKYNHDENVLGTELTTQISLISTRVKSINHDNIHEAVLQWCQFKDLALAEYGPIEDWQKIYSWI